MPKLRLLILVGELGSVVRMRRCLGRDLARSNSYRSFKPVLAPFDYAICNDVSVWLILRGKHWRLTCTETHEFSNVGYLGRAISAYGLKVSYYIDIADNETKRPITQRRPYARSRDSVGLKEKTIEPRASLKDGC